MLNYLITVPKSIRNNKIKANNNGKLNHNSKIKININKIDINLYFI